MICPFCGANNPADAVFCRRCRQRLPASGTASGVSYPYRRTVAYRTRNRLPMVAAMFFIGAALAGILLAFFLSTPRGTPGQSEIAVVSPSPEATSTLPAFVQDTPTPSPAPTPFFPTAEPSPSPTVEITPTPTPTPTKTPKPTPKPTPTPTATPKLTCAAATGTPTDSVVIGYGNKTQKKSQGWCLDSATFHIVTLIPPGSTYGTAKLLLNGNKIASYSCNTAPDTCENDVVVPLNQKLAKVGAVLSYKFTCIGDETDPNACTDPGFNATVTIKYEAATEAP